MCQKRTHDSRDMVWFCEAIDTEPSASYSDVCDMETPSSDDMKNLTSFLKMDMSSFKLNVVDMLTEGIATL